MVSPEYGYCTLIWFCCWNNNYILLYIHKCSFLSWWRYRQKPSCQLIAIKSQFFPVKNWNLQSSVLVGFVATRQMCYLQNYAILKSSAFIFKNFNVFQFSLFTKANLQTSKNPFIMADSYSRQRCHSQVVNNFALA